MQTTTSGVAGPPERRTPAQWLFVACGAWLIGLGCYFIFLRPALLPEDLRYLGTDSRVLHAAAPRLDQWLTLVFTVMGGFMAGTGVLVAYLAWRVLPRRAAGTVTVMAISGALTVALMSAVNFALGSDFRWLLLGPPVAWLAAVFACYARARPPRQWIGRAPSRARSARPAAARRKRASRRVPP